MSTKTNKDSYTSSTMVHSHYNSIYSYDSAFDELNNLHKDEAQWQPDELNPDIDVLKETRLIVGRK